MNRRGFLKTCCGGVAAVVGGLSIPSAKAGSCAMPKGVTISHRNGRLHEMMDEYARRLAQGVKLGSVCVSCDQVDKVDWGLAVLLKKQIDFLESHSATISDRKVLALDMGRVPLLAPDGSVAMFAYWTDYFFHPEGVHFTELFHEMNIRYGIEIHRGYLRWLETKDQA